jgi:hypothetical protein
VYFRGFLLRGPAPALGSNAEDGKLEANKNRVLPNTNELFFLLDKKKLGVFEISKVGLAKA